MHDTQVTPVFLNYVVHELGPTGEIQQHSLTILLSSAERCKQLWSEFTPEKSSKGPGKLQPLPFILYAWRISFFPMAKCFLIVFSSSLLKHSCRRVGKPLLSERVFLLFGLLSYFKLLFNVVILAWLRVSLKRALMSQF